MGTRDAACFVTCSQHHLLAQLGPAAHPAIWLHSTNHQTGPDSTGREVKLEAEAGTRAGHESRVDAYDTEYKRRGASDEPGPEVGSSASDASTS